MTSETVETAPYADVEAAVVGALQEATDATVATRIPNPRPASETYARVGLAGGTDRNQAQADVRIQVEAWAPERASAWYLVAALRARLAAAQDSWLAPGVWVARVQLGWPAADPDPATGSPRYSFVAQLTVS